MSQLLKVEDGKTISAKGRQYSRSGSHSERTRKPSDQLPTQIGWSTQITQTTGFQEMNNMGFSSIMHSIPLIAEYRQHRIVQNRIRTKEEILKIWKIGRVISHGSTATVRKAFNNLTGQLVAVKQIVFDEKDQELHKKELRILCKIGHRNVIRYIEHQAVNKETWIFMEYIPNTLQTLFKSYGKLPLENYLNFAKQLIQALDYLHSQKIVHRDIKCSNILLDDDGTLKLSDFGCSKGFNQTLSFMNYEKQGCRTFKGSILWMAPEVIKSAIYNRKTDIWSMGCSLLQLATAQNPWQQKSFDNEMTALWIIAGEGQVPQIPENLHKDIRWLIGSCLKRQPDERLTTRQLLKAEFFNTIQ